MKRTFNFTFCDDDLFRYKDREDFLSVLERGFDGIELNFYQEDKRGVVPVENIIGLHMSYFPCWLDFWRQNEEKLIKEYGSMEEAERQFGGKGKEAILARFRRDLANAKRFGAEYVVFHVSDCYLHETFTFRYTYSDEEVIDAACEIINELCKELDGSMAFLMENLWQPGLTFTRPEMTCRLLEGVHYENKGIMLDTGHLMHTNFNLQTQEEALAYINEILDEHGELCKHIRGVHLHQSLTGEFCKTSMKQPPVLPQEYQQRQWKMYEQAFAVDKHLPFTCKGVDKLIARIAPEYLTFEFITENRRQHDEFLAMQLAALSVKG